MASKTLRVGEIFDDISFTPYQYVVCGLCFLITFFEGLDITVIGLALPKIADFLHSKPAALGLALTAGQFGPMIGALILGTLADRFGRKWMLVICAMLFGVFTVTTVTIASVQDLALYRFLAGLGLGGSVPIALAFGSEYAPARTRKSVLAVLYAGIPAGAMIGGLSSAWLIPHLGWRSLFVLGGVIPVLIGFLLVLVLPESLEFLVRRGKEKDKVRVRKIVSRISPALARDEEVEFTLTGKKLPGAPVKHLFREGRGVDTVLLWLICAGALYMLWILNTWAPTLLRKNGATVQQYSLAYACLCAGALISMLVGGRLLDKMNSFRVLAVGFVLAAISLAVFGVVAGTGSILGIIAMSVVCGVFINGSQMGTMVVATVYYPPSIRGTGIGWAGAAGKFGAMSAPAMGGLLLGMNWGVSRICVWQSMVGLLVAVLLMVLQRHVAAAETRGRSTLAAAVQAAN